MKKTLLLLCLAIYCGTGTAQIIDSLPLREATTIAYQVHRPGPVTITVYDLLGRSITTLVDARQAVGNHQVAWDGMDTSGQKVAAGAYFYQLRVNEAVTSNQAIRIR